MTWGEDEAPEEVRILQEQFEWMRNRQTILPLHATLLPGGEDFMVCWLDGNEIKYKRIPIPGPLED